MAVPLILVVLFSFNKSALTSLPLTGFTLDWYRKLFTLGAFWPALWNSLIVRRSSRSYRSRSAPWRPWCWPACRRNVRRF